MSTPTFDDIRRAIETRFTTEWAAKGNPIPISRVVFENLDYNPNNNTYIAVTIEPVISENIALGGLLQRHEAEIVCKIHVRKKEGMVEYDELSQDIHDIFNNVQFSGISTRATGQELPELEGNFYAGRVVTPFFYDVTP